MVHEASQTAAMALRVIAEKRGSRVASRVAVQSSCSDRVRPLGSTCVTPLGASARDRSAEAAEVEVEGRGMGRASGQPHESPHRDLAHRRSGPPRAGNRPGHRRVHEQRNRRVVWQRQVRCGRGFPDEARREDGPDRRFSAGVGGRRQGTDGGRLQVVPLRRQREARLRGGHGHDVRPVGQPGHGRAVPAAHLGRLLQR